MKTGTGLFVCADLCIAYALRQDWIDSVVLGVDSMNQMQDNLGLVRGEPLAEADGKTIREAWPEIPEKLLNPALWGKAGK